MTMTRHEHALGEAYAHAIRASQVIERAEQSWNGGETIERSDLDCETALAAALAATSRAWAALAALELKM